MIEARSLADVKYRIVAASDAVHHARRRVDAAEGEWWQKRVKQEIRTAIEAIDEAQRILRTLQ